MKLISECNINQILVIKDDDLYSFYDYYNHDIKITEGLISKLPKQDKGLLDLLLIRALAERTLSLDSFLYRNGTFPKKIILLDR